MQSVKPLFRTLLALTLATCAAPGGPRVIVQADAIDKEDLAGEWYFRQTVVSAPYSTGFTFIGEQGDNELERVVFEIAEDSLIVRRAIEFVRGSEADQPSQQSGGRYVGAPVAAFRIKGHFDIVRDYNPATGEEFDRIVENTERKWFDRRFVRVDWSTNLVTNFNFLVDWNWMDGVRNIRQDPVPYYVSDPKDPDAIRVERPDNKSAATYLEVTQKIIAHPETVDFWDWADVPLCWLEYQVKDCASQEIKVRNSFVKATKRDYDPLVYSDKAMERFGYFTTERKSYNRQYGPTETGRQRFINRHNLFRRSLTTQACKADSECGAAAPGRHCSLDAPGSTYDPASGTRTGFCTYPYSVRNLANPDDATSADLGPKTIVYYLNADFPESLKEAAIEVGEEYDVTYKDLLKTLTGREVTGTAFAICANNPVKEGDPAYCGPAGTTARIGDIRFSMLYWVDNPTSAGLLGYGPSSNDPETGETIQANAFVYGAPIDEYSAQARDIVRLVNGELRPSDYVDGENVQDWVAANIGGEKGKRFGREAFEKAAAAMDTKWTAGLPKANAIRKASTRKMAEQAREHRRTLANSQQFGANPGHSVDRLAALDGTAIDRALASGEVLMSRGLDPRTAAAGHDHADLHPARHLSPTVRRSMQELRRRLGSRGVDLAATVDDAAIGFALAQKGKDPQEVWRTVRRLVFKSTALHEVGHTVGLRHNFAGSYDPMNYFDDYWTLRNDGTMGPRAVDPESEAETEGVELASGLRAGISEFQYSSIMDYGARFNSDIQGLGRYDKAALKFGYGQLVEVFTDVSDRYTFGALQSTVTFGMPEPVVLTCDGNDLVGFHYTKLPSIVDLKSRADVHFSDVENIVPEDTNCAFPDPVDVDPLGRFVVPYKFCSDEFESASVECLAYDRGADVYEQAQNAMDAYKNNYLFNNFRRDKLDFDPEWYLDRILFRYLEVLRQQMQFYALFKADYTEFMPDGHPFWSDVDDWGGFTLAVQQGFDLMGEIIATPEPGPYYLYDRGDGVGAYLPDEYGEGAPAFRLPIPQGRYMETAWDWESGYYWYEQLTHVGVFLDKVAAMYEIADPSTYFVGKDEAADLRQYSISYWRLYPKQIEKLFGSVLTDDWASYAPIFTPGGTGYRHQSISQPAALPANTLTVDPQVSFSAQLWAGTLGMSLLPMSWDRRFADSARLWLEGGDFGVAPGTPLKRWTDPISGKVFVALTFPEGGEEMGVAARMLARAEALEAQLAEGPEAEQRLELYVQILEMMRTLTVAYADWPLF